VTSQRRIGARRIHAFVIVGTARPLPMPQQVPLSSAAAADPRGHGRNECRCRQ
jgi:hypothetical protein